MFRPILAAAPVLALLSGPAFAEFTDARVDLGFHSFDQDGDTLSSTTLDAGVAMTFGRFGAQFDLGGTNLTFEPEDGPESEATVSYVRAIGTYAISPEFTAGLSIGRVATDDSEDDLTVYGLHGLYRTGTLRLEAALTRAQDEDGTVAMLDAQVWATPAIEIDATLVRSFGDGEDYGSVRLGAVYAVTPALGVFADVTSTDTGDGSETDRFARIGARYDFGDSTRVWAAVGRGETESEEYSGLSLGVSYSFGGNADNAATFRGLNASLPY